MPKGTITLEDTITKEALEWGLKYERNLKKAERANKDLIETAKQLATITNSFKVADSQKQYTTVLNNQAKALKTVEASEINRNKALVQAERAKTQQLRNEKLLLDIQAKKLRASKGATKQTIEERVATQALNRVKRQEVREQLGLVDSYEKLSRQRNKAQRDLQNLLASNKANNAEIAVAQRRYTTLNARLQKVDSATDNFSRNIGNYRSALGGLTGTLGSLTSALGVAGGAFAFVQVLRNGVNIVREFDLSMQTLSGVLRTNRTDLRGLEQEIANVGATTVRSGTQTAELANTLATLGKSADEISLLLKPVTDLSVGLQASSADAGAFLVQSLNAFGASSAEAERYADIIATIRTSTSLDFQKIRDSFQFLAPISRSLGKDIADTGALIGILADNGIKAERAGRLLSTAQQRLAGENKTLSDGLSELNDFIDSGATEIESLAKASELFGQQASGLGIILANNTEAIEENADAIRNNGGALDELVDSQLDSLDGAIKLLTSAWEGYILNTNEATSVGNTLKESIQFLAENLKDILNGVVFLTKAYVTYTTVSKLATLQQSLFGKAVAVSNRQQVIARAVSIAQAKGLTTVSASTVRATLATRALGNALKANAIGIGIAVVFGLVKAFEALNKSAIETSKEVREVNNEFVDNQKEVSKTQSNLDRLNSRYKELTSEGLELTKEEQQELNQVVKDIQSIVPDTIVKVDEYGNSLITNSDKIDQFSENQRRLNDLLKEERISETKEAIEELENTLDRLNRNYREQNGELQKRNRNGSAFGKITDKQEISVRKLRAETEKEIELQKEQLLNLQGLLSERQKQTKSVEEQAKAEAEANKKTEQDEATKEKIRKSAFDLLRFRQQETIRLSKEIADNEEESVDARVRALTEISIAEIELARLEKNNALASAENQVQKQLAVEQFASAKVASEENASRTISEILTAEQDRIDRLQSQSLNKRVADQLKAVNQIKTINETAQNNEIALANREIKDVEAREKRIAEIKEFYAKQALTAQLEALTSLVNGEDLTADQRIDLEKKVSDIKRMLSEVSLSDAEKTTEKTSELVASSLQEISGLAQDINGLLSAFGERRIANIDNEISQNEEFFNKQIELAGEDDRKKEELEQKQEQRRLQLEAKKRREQVKQARIEKAFALAQIAIQTAIGIATATGTFFGISLIPFIIATGAIQAATVLATPIPQFEKGTGDTPHKGGFAEVAEKRPEVIIEPNKRPYIVSKRQILDLPKGTEVIPSVEEFKNMQNRDIKSRLQRRVDKNMHYHNESSYTSNFDDSGIIDELKRSRKSKQPIIINNVINKGFKRGGWNE